MMTTTTMTMTDNAARPGAPRHVLLIDDDPHLAEVIQARLAGVFGELVLNAARDGSRGFDLARSILPSLILLDYQMPGLDGFETLRQLRTDARTAPIPIVTISGAIPTRGRCAEMIARTDAHLSKPFTFERLARVLARFFPSGAAAWG